MCFSNVAGFIPSVRMGRGRLGYNRDIVQDLAAEAKISLGEIVKARDVAFQLYCGLHTLHLRSESSCGETVLEARIRILQTVF